MGTDKFLAMPLETRDGSSEYIELNSTPKQVPGEST